MSMIDFEQVQKVKRAKPRRHHAPWRVFRRLALTNRPFFERYCPEGFRHVFIIERYCPCRSCKRRRVFRAHYNAASLYANFGAGSKTLQGHADVLDAIAEF